MQIEFTPVTEDLRLSKVSNVAGSGGEANGNMALLAVGFTLIAIGIYYAGRYHQAKRLTTMKSSATSETNQDTELTKDR